MEDLDEPKYKTVFESTLILKEDDRNRSFPKILRVYSHEFL